MPGDNPWASDLPPDDLGGGPPPTAGSCAEQGLDELCRRRDLAPVKPSDAVIDPDGWSQPETVVFHDTQTGAEMIRLTDDPAGSEQHCHINRSTFNADGSLVSFGSRRCWPGYYCPDNYRYVTELHGRGPHVISLPPEHRLWTGPYEAWDPSDPNAFLFVNYLENNGLYRVTVDDGAFNVSKLLDPPNPDRRKAIFANVAPDGTVAFKDTELAGQPVHVYVWHPASPSELVTFDLALDLVHPDHSAASESGVHDFTLRRNAEDSIIFNYGPQSDVGEPLFLELASDGSKAYRISYAPNEDVNCPVPYYSHPAWNRDGTRVAYNGTAAKFVAGTNPDGSPHWTWDDSQWGSYLHAVSPFATTEAYSTSTLVTKIAELAVGLVHFGWDGYDDRWVHGVTTQDADPLEPIYRMATDGSVTERLANTHAQTFCGAACDYCSLPRPAQSPDATKVLFVSDMLQRTPNAEDLYLAVHRYPFAPVWLGLTSPNELRLSWRFHAELARETRRVRVLRSQDVTPPVFEDLTGPLAADSFLDDTVGLTDGASILYAVTGIEQSGLESRRLSRVIRVTRTGDTYRVDQLAPYGTAGFDTTPPAAPSQLAASVGPSGALHVTWTAPSDSDVRLVHLYAAVGADPAISQGQRIASLPPAHPTYLDWSFGSGELHYAVTAEDFQGNESAPARITVTP